MSDFSDAVITLDNVAKAFPAIIQFVTALGYVSGVVLILIGLFELKRNGEMRLMMGHQASMKAPLIQLIVGVLLIYAIHFLGLIEAQTFGAKNILSYESVYSSMDPTFRSMYKNMVMFVQVIGIVSFIRGLLILRQLGQQGGQPGLFYKGLMHILGGFLGVNILGLIEVMQNTVLGTG